MKGVILVIASEDDGSGQEDVRRRMQPQMVAGDKRKLSDYIIQNDGDMQSLVSQVSDLIPLLNRL